MEQFGAFQADGSLDHCFVFGHSPLYTVKMDTSMDATALTAAGRDVFVQEAGSLAEIYFCGHEHFYDHTLISGTAHPGGQGIDALHQVLVGTGGAEIDRVTETGCDYSASYVRDPARQYYHNPEVSSSGDPQPYIGYNMVTVSGPDVTFLWKAWHVDNPCHFPALPHPMHALPVVQRERPAGDPEYVELHRATRGLARLMSHQLSAVSHQLPAEENLATKAFWVPPGQVWAGFFSGKSSEEVSPVTTTLPLASTATPYALSFPVPPR